MGTALGRQGPNNGRARVAGPPRKKPRGRSPVPQFDAQACPNTNRCPPAFGMAERRESLRGKAWHSAQPTSGNAENEPHTSLDGSLLVRPVFARADCGAATDGQPIRQRYRTLSVAIPPANRAQPAVTARSRSGRALAETCQPRPQRVPSPTSDCVVYAQHPKRRGYPRPVARLSLQARPDPTRRSEVRILPWRPIIFPVFIELPFR